jgi:PAT family beta-lactamase induction signal transducer AmpG
MGMPFVVLNMVSTLMYKGMGVSDAQIAFWTSLIMLPWTLKPLWSPFLEIYKSKKFFVVFTQVFTGVVFALVAFALNLPSFFAITIAMLAIIALSGATHDIAADGTYMSVLSNEEQARWIGWQGAFYNIAKIAATGGLVYLAGTFIGMFGVTKAWMIIMLIISCIMVGIGIYHYFILPNPLNDASNERKTLHDTLHELLNVFLDFFSKKHILYYICFIILYRFAEGFVMKIVPLFLKAPRTEQGLGLSEQQIGLYYGTFGAAAFVIGSILAGYYIARRGLKRSLFSLAVVFNIPFVAYTMLALYQPQNLWLIGGGIVMEYFGYGFGLSD